MRKRPWLPADPAVSRSPAWSDPAPRSVTRSPLRDVPVPVGSPADPSLRGRSDPAAIPARHQSRGRCAASSSFSRASRFAAPEFTSRTCTAILQPRRVAYSRIARLCIASVCWSFVENAGVQARPEHFRRFPYLTKKRVRISLSEKPVLWAFRNVTQPWPQSILSGQAGFIILRSGERDDLRQGFTIVSGHPFRRVRYRLISVWGVGPVHAARSPRERGCAQLPLKPAGKREGGAEEHTFSFPKRQKMPNYGTRPLSRLPPLKPDSRAYVSGKRELRSTTGYLTRHNKQAKFGKWVRVFWRETRAEHDANKRRLRARLSAGLPLEYRSYSSVNQANQGLK
jgi:hypothetical protein